MTSQKPGFMVEGAVFVDQQANTLLGLMCVCFCERAVVTTEECWETRGRGTKFIESVEKKCSTAFLNVSLSLCFLQEQHAELFFFTICQGFLRMLFCVQSLSCEKEEAKRGLRQHRPREFFVGMNKWRVN